MKAFAAVFVLLCLAPASVFAQAATGGRYSFCQVNDTGKRDIWVSQVFPTPPGTDLMDTALASEFHAYVGTLGGAGDKTCVTAVSRAAAEETRARIAAIMGKRSFGIHVYDWHDVNWTPSAATYANTTPAPLTAAAKFVYCRSVDTDKRVLVTSGIFVQTMPPMNDMAYFKALTRYASEFGARAAATHGVDAQDALCIPSDTQAEADKSRNDFRKSFPFSGIKKVDLDFTPGPAPATDAVAPAMAAAPTATQPPAVRSSGTVDDVEEDFWRRMSSSKAAEDFEDYLAAYPQGSHAPVARLEAKRLRRAGGAPAVTAKTKAKAKAATKTASAVARAASVPAADPDHPIDEAVGRQVAGDAFFQLPVGTGEVAHRSGTRIVNQTVPVTADGSVQRVAGSNQCRLDITVLAGEGGLVRTVATGQTWAGIIPLSMRSKTSSQYAVIDGVIKAVAIDKLVGQPFPLVAGNTFGWSVTYENVDNTTGTTRYGQDWSCRVGATAPASTSIPGMPGEQTELQCNVRFVSLALPPQDQVIDWYSAAGCFMQDPTR
ncbi:hypothetical protein [Cognatiluteimonas profundi]|uniref:hypothetical protein n=1 Tax=Cognatiluteimonas profundi TaxID=2594501 RepID=UPI00131E1C0D|nr:hypothetical protein [Lysobacter profundi]